MQCCPLCFGDSFLGGKIAREGKGIGRCDYCNSRDQPLVDPSALTEDFETVFTAYEEEPRAVSPALMLKNEWHLFSTSPHADHDLLLDHILGDGFHAKTFQVDAPAGQLKVQEWEDFRVELKHKLRFLPDSGPNLDQLEELLEHLEIELEPRNYFRARIQTNIPYRLDEMGMPPVDLCGNGRANPGGSTISVHCIRS